MQPIRVLIADDHPLFLDGLRLLIEFTPDLALVGEARSGQEAVMLAASEKPDLILLDIGMPGLNGINAARRILEADPQSRILILTMFDDDDSILAALQAGVGGYILKGATQEETLRAMRAAANGEMIVAPHIARRMREYVQAQSASQPAFPQLTARELEVLELVAAGLLNPEIAGLLVLSEKTVRNHISHIFHKLRVANRKEAILAARQAGLGKRGADQAD